MEFILGGLKMELPYSVWRVKVHVKIHTISLGVNNDLHFGVFKYPALHLQTRLAWAPASRSS